jgi:hypothetical protein
VAGFDSDLGDQLFEQGLSGRGGAGGHDVADLGLQLVQQAGLWWGGVRGGQLVLQLRLAGLELG